MWKAEKLSKLQLSIKYEWEERQSEKCECLYCVMMETISRKYEIEEIPAKRKSHE